MNTLFSMFNPDSKQSFIETSDNQEDASLDIETDTLLDNMDPFGRVIEKPSIDKDSLDDLANVLDPHILQMIEDGAKFDKE